MPFYGYVLLAISWILWVIPFFLAQRQKQTANVIDRRARWGMLLMAIAYSLLWQGKFWLHSLPEWRLALGILFLAQWRMDAGLNTDHQLVRSGPYRFVRHPIYASMFAILLGTGFVITSKWLLIAAVIVFIAGAEVRIRIEDKLLALHFGTEFQNYQRNVSAYIPFVR